MSDTPASGPKRRKPGCTPCRSRHLKCDRVLPVCSSCRRARYPVTCEYQQPALKVRQSLLSVIAANTSRARRDQADGGQSGGSGPFETGDIRSPPQSPHQGETLFEPLAWPETQLRNGRGAEFAEAPHVVVAEPVQPSSTSPEAGLEGLEDGLPRNNQSIHSPSTDKSFQLPSSDRRLVSNSVDAKVFGFYISHIGYWIDIVSPSRYFSETVPQIALNSPALYYACLTCASRVLTRRGELGKAKGDEYEDTAISALIPQLSSAPTLAATQGGQHESLIATAVILRMAEQFYEVCDDARCHLVGASSLFASGKPESPSLGAASFWLYMRQAIRAAFLNEEPCNFDMMGSLEDDDNTSVTTGTITDVVWTNQVTTLLAQACSACWDTSPDAIFTQHERLGELGDRLEKWKRDVPDTFQPWCEYRAENDPFPVIRYVCSWHVVAWQYFYAAKVLVALYKKPRNMSMIEMSRYTEVSTIPPSAELSYDNVAKIMMYNTG